MNKRVFVILQSSTSRPETSSFYKDLVALPNYQRLLRVSQDWTASTFEGLVALASSLGTFGSRIGPDYLDILAPLVDALNRGDHSAKPRFDATVNSLSGALGGLYVRASELLSSFKSFDIEMAQADVSGSGAPDPLWNVFSRKAGAAFDVLDGRFEILCRDLKDLKTTVDDQISQWASSHHSDG